jgi:outer membrane receptor protein involved in Fe transport
VGYNTKTVAFNGTTDFGTISLEPSAEALDEIVITQTSFAIERKTPVAVSTVRADIIENKLGTQEFPEILKATPGVYATKSGGGFGDGRINLRGFNSENVAVMINGVPVNDMENGRLYWSNWAGLADVTSAMQVQRGLGASKVAVPSIGGTINIITKSTDVSKGGNVFMGIGNDGYSKYGVTLSTGLLDNGFAATVSAAKTTGDGYVDGTEFNGLNYFVNISKQLNENHKLSLTTFGAPQKHGQRQNRSTIDKYRTAASGLKFNPDWGIMNGEVYHIQNNFYHKNKTIFNHYWTISDKTNLSTALYGSWGSGGGSGNTGDMSLFNVRLGGADMPVDLDYIVDANRASGPNGGLAWIYASRNDHNWYGMLSTFKTEINDNLDLVAGLDLRDYKGIHFREIYHALGADYILDNSDVNNPDAALRTGDKFSYFNDGEVGWQGVFAQLEYDNDKVSTFISTSLSNTSYRRVDYFNYLDSDPLQTTDKYNFTGYSVKGGLNYNLNDEHNLFANIGYFEKAAGFDAVFLNFDNEHINEDAENQKIFSAELGYGFRGSTFAANLNVYYTQWNDRTFTDNFTNGGVEYFVNLLGVNALHQGVELDFQYRPSDKFIFTGMLSLGDWKWDSNVLDAQVYDDANNPVGDPINLYIEGLKVADAAQTTAALGMEVQLMDKTWLAADYNFFGNMFADYDPNNRNTAGEPQPWEAPEYGTFDASLRYGFKFGEFDTTIIARMNNVLDTEYIADARDGSLHDASTAQVWYGYGRTFSLSAKVRF